MTQKKILVEFLGKNGAGTTFTLEVVKALINCNMDVWVILSDKILNKYLWEELGKTNRIYIEFIETGNKNNFFKTTVKFLLKKRKILKEHQDIIFDYALRTFPHPWLEFIERKLHIKRVFYILHDPIPHTGTEMIRKIISKRNIKTADDIVVLSEKFINPVIERYKVSVDKVHYMKLGLLPVYPDEKESCNIRIENFEKYKYKFLFFGRIDKYKGLHVLAKAYSQIKRKYDLEIALIIAGGGDFQEYKEEFAALKDVYIYNRYINDKEIKTLFSLKNVIVVLPYLDATQSGVITVAAEYTKTVIASDSGALREQLNNGEVGIFFPPGNADELEKCMESLLNDESLLLSEEKKMKIFKESLDWNIIMKDFLADLEKIR